MHTTMRDRKSTQLTLDEAYQATYLWLDHMGDPPVKISEPAHGSVELLTETAFVRVRSSDGPVEQSSVLALLRAATPDRRLLLFSPSGFSPGALSIAETQGIALFTLDTDGRALPETTHARLVAPETEPDPPFASEPTESTEDQHWTKPSPPTFISDVEDDPEVEPDDEAVPDGIGAATSDWSECPKCGTTHHRHANFCKQCGAKMQSTPSTVSLHLRCRACGSHDIEELE